jgi:ribosome-binding protein aMBF1 (putative translation factor)
MSIETHGPWLQCDCCSRLTDRLHHCVAYGTDTAACDDCAHYAAAA